MWLPNKAFEVFEVSKESVSSLREDNAALRAERDSLKLQLASSQGNFNWICMRVNSLEIERAQLLEKAYGIKVPVPEIVRSKSLTQDLLDQFSFEDMGDEKAKQLGLPTYGN